ncbi:phage holin family protein [Clostridium sp. BJN0001]|uniref:phage holin family protein n=1 Tax=Clostridium sp. BJN0001 TaxID=2930219 RepID=UPI001FD43AA2|nr:phage holin family protein [Clostridium sp. BJN0001]
MELTNLMDYLPPYMVLLVAAAMVLGQILKSLECIKDKYITLFLGAFVLTIAVILSIINAQYKVTLDAIINGILQGTIVWGVAIGINQTYKQLKKDE